MARGTSGGSVPPGDGAARTPGRRVRLSDVAAASGVSTATASRALSGQQTISRPTRRLVERTAARLGYRVNPVARALSLQRTFTIGLVVADLTNPFYAELARGIDSALRDTRYVYFLADLGGDGSRQPELVEHMVARRVDGIVVTIPHDASVLARTDVPLVAIDRVDGTPFVGVDNVAGGRLAAEHLLAQGYRRPGLLYADPQLTPVADRRAGFATALAAAGVAVRDTDQVCCASLGYDDAYTGALQLLRTGVDSVFCVDDVMAAATIAATLELGLTIPGDVGVAGYDDTPMAAWRTLDLTSVDQDMVALGRAAAAMIIQRIEEPEAPTRSVTLMPTLVVRGSTAGPRHRRT